MAADPAETVIAGLGVRNVRAPGSTITTATDAENHLDFMCMVHNPRLVQLALSLLACSKNGLRPRELEDAVSLEDSILNEIFEKEQFIPTEVRRIPINVFAQLKKDMSALTGPKIVDDCRDVLVLSSDAVRQVVVKRWLQNDFDFKAQCHELLVDMFSGLWANSNPKPFVNTERLVDQFSVPRNSAAPRQLSSMPTRITQPHNQFKFNARKLRELPYHLQQLARWDELEDLCCDFEFVLGTLCLYNTGFDETVGLFLAASTATRSSALEAVHDALVDSKAVLIKDPHQLAHQLAARLFRLAAPEQQTVVLRLLESARRVGDMRHVQLVPRFALMASKRVPADKIIVHSKPSHVFASASASNVLLAGCDDKTVSVWDQATATVRTIMTGWKDWVRGVDISANGRLAIVGSWDTTVWVLDLETYQLLYEFSEHVTYVNGVGISDGGAWGVSVGEDASIIVWDLKHGTKKCETVGHDDAILKVAIVPGTGHFITACADGTLKLWDFSGPRLLATFRAHRESVTCLAVASDGKSFVTGSADRNVMLWALETYRGQPVSGDVVSPRRTYPGLTDPIASVDMCLQPAGFVVSGTEQGLIRLWSLDHAAHPLATFLIDKPSIGPVYVHLPNNAHCVYVSCSSGVVAQLCLWGSEEAVRRSGSIIEATQHTVGRPETLTPAKGDDTATVTLAGSSKENGVAHAPGAPAAAAAAAAAVSGGTVSGPSTSSGHRGRGGRSSSEIDAVVAAARAEVSAAQASISSSQTAASVTPQPAENGGRNTETHDAQPAPSMPAGALTRTKSQPRPTSLVPAVAAVPPSQAASSVPVLLNESGFGFVSAASTAAALNKPTAVDDAAGETKSRGGILADTVAPQIDASMTPEQKMAAFENLVLGGDGGLAAVDADFGSERAKKKSSRRKGGAAAGNTGVAAQAEAPLLLPARDGSSGGGSSGGGGCCTIA